MQTRMSPCLTLWSFICQCKDIVYDHPDMFVCAVFFFNWNGHSWIHASISKHFFFCVFSFVQVGVHVMKLPGRLWENIKPEWASGLALREEDNDHFVFVYMEGVVFFFLFATVFRAQKKLLCMNIVCTRYKLDHVHRVEDKTHPQKNSTREPGCSKNKYEPLTPLHICVEGRANRAGNSKWKPDFNHPLRNDLIRV